jgi:hypothetical protein
MGMLADGLMSAYSEGEGGCIDASACRGLAIVSPSTKCVVWSPNLPFEEPHPPQYRIPDVFYNSYR